MNQPVSGQKTSAKHRKPLLKVATLPQFDKLFADENILYQIKELVHSTDLPDYDEFGFRREVFEFWYERIIGPLFHKVFRCEVNGIDHIPSEGPVLLVINHSGTVPLDALLMKYGVWRNHPAHRVPRGLAEKWLPTIPFIGVLGQRMGEVLACPENGEALLKMGKLVFVFPEGVKGTGKGWKRRYRLQRFGRGGFIKLALANRARLVPIAITGCEETYPMIANIQPLAKLLGMPYFPVTPTFPHLGLIGALPIPAKVFIDILSPLEVSADEGVEIAQDPVRVLELTDDVRQRIQKALIARLKKRSSVIFG